jgi:CubicO group peptidase (beta-lactamase class C family)
MSRSGTRFPARLRPARVLGAFAFLAAVGCATETAPQTSAEVFAPDVAARIAAFESGFPPAGDSAAAPSMVQERMAEYGVAGLSIAVIDDGEVAWAKGYGVLQTGSPEPVDNETVFSVGSVSKVGTAAATLRLVDAGRLELDRDVNELLTTWQVPEHEFEEDVTLRRIMSHTAGLTVHGFRDYQPGAELPTTVQIVPILGRRRDGGAARGRGDDGE